MRYITRFTEESFACLIALIFIYEAFKKMAHILEHDGVYLDFDRDRPILYDCICEYPNKTGQPTVDPTGKIKVLEIY